MVAADILTGDTLPATITSTTSSSSTPRSNKESHTPYPDDNDHYPYSSTQEPLLSSINTTTRGHHTSDHHHHHSLYRSASSSSSSSTYSSTHSPIYNQQQPQSPSLLSSGTSFLSGCFYSSIALCYNRLTAWLFPNEPEHLDLASTIFFIAQVPFLFLVFLTWIPSFVVWLVGWKVSQAGDRGKGQGMRKTWSIRLALSLSFLQVYLRHADKLTIEDCQGRSRSIPFMTAPAGIRVNKIKIPAFPFRNRAESIVYEHLTEQERGWLHWHKKEAEENDHCQGEANKSKASREQKQEGGLSVKVQRETDVELDMIQTDRKMTRSKKIRKKAQKEDKFAEGLDAEWLEYVGPAETDADKAEMTSDNMAAVLYFHGGGYYTGSKEEHRVLIGPLVRRLGKHVRILTINYRLAPQHPFPAALVDALSCYMWLLDQSVSETFGFTTTNPQRPTDNFQPRQIVFMGDSAGGGLALALSLLLRDHASPSIPQPVKIVTWSPWLDLSQALPSFKENALTDCIPYEDFTHLHSDAVDGMFGHEEFPEEAQEEGGKVVRQRAQVYCPDSCLKMKYVSPLYEKDFSGIPDVLIVCGSAERFANECILMANRLEEQQQTCRIDIHEDMPHIFPLFRFHPSSAAALDRTSAFIREAVTVSAGDYTLEASGRNGRTGRNRSDSVVIPISPSSSSGSSSASLSPLPSPSPSPRLDIGELIDDVDEDEEGYFRDERGARRIRRVDSSSSLSSAGSNSTSTTLQQQQQEQRQRRRVFDTQPVRSFDLDLADDPHHQDLKTKKKKKKKRTAVNVIDLSGTSVMSYHKQTRFGTPSDRDRALQETEEAGLLDGGRRRRKRDRLTLQDVVTDATVYEWEVLLGQGYIPTRHWPLPPTGGGRSGVQARRRRV